jgi:recombination protein RecT
MSEELVKREEPKTIRALLDDDKFKVQVARALPKHLTPDRFMRVAATAIMKTPLLKECEQVSFINALLSLSQLGIEPDGRRAHLIPFKNNKRGVVECTLIIDYKGLVELAMRSGTVANIHADVVCENDVFVYDCGEIKEHKINFRQPRGKVYAAYAMCKFKDGTVKAEVMSLEEIGAIKDRSKAGSFGPWITDWNEMAKKTVFRRLSKWLPLSPEYREILDHDADTFDPVVLNPKANVIPPPMKKDAVTYESAHTPYPENYQEFKTESKPEEEPEREAPPDEEPPMSRPQPGETEPPDMDKPDENTIDGLKVKIEVAALRHFPNPNSFSLWLKTLTRNEEKGWKGLDSLEQSKSFNQLRFIHGALKREMDKKK